MHTVKDLIQEQRLLFARPEMSVQEAAKYMDMHNIGALPIIAEDMKLAGIISERDIIRRCIVKKINLDETPISEVMTKSVIVVESHDTQEY